MRTPMLPSLCGVLLLLHTGLCAPVYACSSPGSSPSGDTNYTTAYGPMDPVIAALIDRFRDQYQRDQITKADLCRLQVESTRAAEQVQSLQALTYLLHEQHVICTPNGEVMPEMSPRVLKEKAS